MKTLEKQAKDPCFDEERLKFGLNSSLETLKQALELSYFHEEDGGHDQETFWHSLVVGLIYDDLG